LAASKTILKEYLANSKDESSPMLWTHQAFSVAACIVIYFDLLHSSSAAQDGANLVEQTIEHLQQCRQKSMIAARGVKVLHALQKQIVDRAESRKRSLEIARKETTRKRRRGFDAVEFARSFENGSSPQPQERHIRMPELSLRPPRIIDDSQIIVGMDESLNLPADMNWIWNMPVNDADGTQTFDSLMSFANHGLGL